MPGRSDAPAPRLLRAVLEPEVLRSLQLHARRLRDGGGLRWEEWGQRHVRHGDPALQEVHRGLTARVQQEVGRPLQPSYSFLACYGEGGRVPAHRDLTARVQQEVGRPLQPSYSFLACYGEGGRVPAHRDRAQCRYTLDLCLEDGGFGEPWPLFVEDRAYLFRTNEALLYHGCEQVHHRLEKPPGTVAHLVFFHFVDAGFAGRLD